MRYYVSFKYFSYFSYCNLILCAHDKGLHTLKYKLMQRGQSHKATEIMSTFRHKMKATFMSIQ